MFTSQSQVNVEGKREIKYEKSEKSIRKFEFQRNISFGKLFKYFSRRVIRSCYSGSWVDFMSSLYMDSKQIATFNWILYDGKLSAYIIDICCRNVIIWKRIPRYFHIANKGSFSRIIKNFIERSLKIYGFWLVCNNVNIWVRGAK